MKNLQSDALYNLEFRFLTRLISLTLLSVTFLLCPLSDLWSSWKRKSLPTYFLVQSFILKFQYWASVNTSGVISISKALWLETNLSYMNYIAYIPILVVSGNECQVQAVRHQFVPATPIASLAWTIGLFLGTWTYQTSIIGNSKSWPKISSILNDVLWKSNERTLLYTWFQLYISHQRDLLNPIFHAASLDVSSFLQTYSPLLVSRAGHFWKKTHNFATF